MIKKKIIGCGIDFFSLLLSAKYNYKLWKSYNRQQMENSERCKEVGKLVRDLWTWETTQQQGIILTPHPADEGNPVPSFMTLTQPCNRSWPRDTDSSLNQNTTNTRQNWEPWQVWWIESHADNSRQRKCTHSPEVTSPTKRFEVAVRHWQGGSFHSKLLAQECSPSLTGRQVPPPQVPGPRRALLPDWAKNLLPNKRHWGSGLG